MRHTDTQREDKDGQTPPQVKLLLLLKHCSYTICERWKNTPRSSVLLHPLVKKKKITCQGKLRVNTSRLQFTYLHT